MRHWLPYLTPMTRARQVDPLLVAALIEVESAGNPWAFRHETPPYRWLYQPEVYAARYRSLGVTLTTETLQQQAAWGFLQMHGAVARERGCEEPFLTVLTQPAICLEFGLAQLCWLRETFDYTLAADLAAAWNGGRARQYKSGPKKGQYHNQGYVTKVVATMAQIREGQE